MKYLVAAVSLAIMASAPAHTQQLEVTPNGSHLTILGPDKAYTGHAIAEILIAQSARSPLEGVEVTFSPGARTAWHNHPKGQYLIITSGVGWVQERGGPKRPWTCRRVNLNNSKRHKRREYHDDTQG